MSRSPSWIDGLELSERLKQLVPEPAEGESEFDDLHALADFDASRSAQRARERRFETSSDEEIKRWLERRHKARSGKTSREEPAAAPDPSPEAAPAPTVSEQPASGHVFEAKDARRYDVGLDAEVERWLESRRKARSGGGRGEPGDGRGDGAERGSAGEIREVRSSERGGGRGLGVRSQAREIDEIQTERPDARHASEVRERRGEGASEVRSGRGSEVREIHSAHVSEVRSGHGEGGSEVRSTDRDQASEVREIRSSRGEGASEVHSAHVSEVRSGHGEGASESHEFPSDRGEASELREVHSDGRGQASEVRERRSGRGSEVREIHSSRGEDAPGIRQIHENESGGVGGASEVRESREIRSEEQGRASEVREIPSGRGSEVRENYEFHSAARGEASELREIQSDARGHASEIRSDGRGEASELREIQSAAHAHASEIQPAHSASRSHSPDPRRLELPHYPPGSGVADRLELFRLWFQDLMPGAFLLADAEGLPVLMEGLSEAQAVLPVSLVRAVYPLRGLLSGQQPAALSLRLVEGTRLEVIWHVTRAGPLALAYMPKIAPVRELEPWVRRALEGAFEGVDLDETR